jgi:hypothetical protein
VKEVVDVVVVVPVVVVLVAVVVTVPDCSVTSSFINSISGHSLLLPLSLYAISALLCSVLSDGGSSRSRLALSYENKSEFGDKHDVDKNVLSRNHEHCA